MLNLGKYVEAPKVVKEVMTLPSPIGWWEVTSSEGEEGERIKNHGTFYGHIVEILFSVPENAGWQYSAKWVTRLESSTRPFRMPVRKLADLSYSSFGEHEKCWDVLGDIKTFSAWINCGDRVKVHTSNLYKTYTLELLN